MIDVFARLCMKSAQDWNQRNHEGVYGGPPSAFQAVFLIINLEFKMSMLKYLINHHRKLISLPTHKQFYLLMCPEYLNFSLTFLMYLDDLLPKILFTQGLYSSR